jgi:hypothetical protein
MLTLSIALRLIFNAHLILITPGLQTTGSLLRVSLQKIPRPFLADKEKSLQCYIIRQFINILQTFEFPAWLFP